MTLALESGGTDNLALNSNNFGTASSRPQLLLSYAPQGFDPFAPTQPTGLNATQANGTVHLTWARSTDDHDVPHYDVYRGTSPTFGPADTNRIATVAPAATATTIAYDDRPGIATGTTR